MQLPFLYNAWYVAAWAEELSPGHLVSRRILDQPVALWRDPQGAVHAIADQCPHRFAPLSAGKVREDGSLECLYHGLRFNGTGQCVHNPHGDGAVPKAARVASYPVVERHTALWIWMGDPAKADASRIVDFSLFDRGPEEGYKTIRGLFTARAHYMLEIDNLMDLSHPEFLHAGSLGSDAMRNAIYESFHEGDTRVHSNRWFAEGPCPPTLAMSFPTGGRMVEHWANMRWDAPSQLMLHVGVTFPGNRREDGLNAWAAHLLTPETQSSTHYFYTHTRTHDLLSEQVDEVIRAGILHAFLREDTPMLERIQQEMGDRDLWSMKPVLLAGDAGGVRSRRLLERLIEAEQSHK